MSRPEPEGGGTLCVHGRPGRGTDAGPLVPPIVQSTAYAWANLDTPPPISYSRSGNPTVGALEARVAALEGGADAVCFSSGVAALDALLWSLPDGSRVIAGRHLYGGSTRLLRLFHAARLRVDEVDSTDLGAVRASLEAPAALVVVETPSNPTLRITDIAATARTAHDAGALLAVDNTLLTPLYQRPLDLGADVVLHSSTKYLEGHNATLGGTIALPGGVRVPSSERRERLADRLRYVRKSTGAILGAFEAFLTYQGVKTLHLRTAAQWSAAGRLARALAGRPGLDRVDYPGLPEHPGYAVHRRQSRGDGGLVALDLGTSDRARRFVGGLRLFSLAENLGSTESLATHPATMTHADLPPDRRSRDGIGDGLVRLSVGVEDPEDLRADVLRSLAELETTPRVPA